MRAPGPPAKPMTNVHSAPTNVPMKAKRMAQPIVADTAIGVYHTGDPDVSDSGAPFPNEPAVLLRRQSLPFVFHHFLLLAA